MADRLVSGGSGLVFKGSGFYITDYGKDGKKDQRKAPETRKGESGSSGGEKGSSGGEKGASGSEKGSSGSESSVKPSTDKSPPKGSGSSDA